MSDNKINIGVVGAGKLGTYHIQKLLTQPETHFVGIYDSNTELMRNHKEEYNINMFDSLDSLINKCEAIIVSTPTSKHYDVSKYALERGSFNLHGNPIVHDLKDAIKLSSIAKTVGKIIQVGHIERFNRAFIESLNYIVNPQFIEIHRISPFPNRSLDIPVVMDVMIHDLDILLSINKGNKIKKIDASGASVVTDFIDLANARIEFDNGLVANLTASRISSKQMRKIRIFQSQSYLGIDLLEKKIDIYNINNDKENFIESKTMNFNDTDALEDELNHFVDCILNSRTPLVSDQDGIEALKLGMQIEELINNKKKG